MAADSSTSSQATMHPPPPFSHDAPQVSINSITIQNIGSMVQTKLKRHNYLVWKSLFDPIFRRYKLAGIVDGSEPAPPRFLSDSSGNVSSTQNPAFEQWYEKDQNILIWINSTLSEDLIPFTVGVQSARELWQNLERRFGGVSRSHIHQLRSNLQSMTKGNSSISEYLQRIKEVTDALAAAGAPVDDHDLLLIILSGLPDDYDSFVDSVQFRLADTTVDDLHGFLLSKEMALARKHTKGSSTEPFQAFHVQSSSSHSSPLLPTPPIPPQPQAYHAHPQQFTTSHRNTSQRPNQNQRHFNSNNRNRFNRFNNNSQNRGGHRGGNRFYNNSKPAPCQICEDPSHQAIDCSNRMNPNFQGRVPPAKLAMYANPPVNSSSPWLIDSGASSHMTNNIQNLQNPQPYSGPDKVYIGDGQGLPIHHYGSSFIQTPNATFQLKNVLHVPHLKHDLLSANMFSMDNWCSLTLNPFDFNVKDLTTGKMLFRGPVQQGLYPFFASPHHSRRYLATTAIRTSPHIWHQRLGHPTFKTFRHVISKSFLPITQTVDQLFCSNCILGKCAKLPFHNSVTHTSRPLELVHADVWGPTPLLSVSGYRFYVLFVDDFTKYTWLYPLKHKSDVFVTFVQFQALVENLSGFKIGTLRTDSGGEFLSSSFQKHITSCGIQHNLSCPHTPQQNGCAERKHRHVVETARTLLIASKVPHQFWVEAFLTATYLINRLPPISKPSPWEQFFHKPPDYSQLRVFGCRCYPWLKPYITSKLDAKSKPCVFLGYSLNHKGYRCLDPITNRVYISRHVYFDETTFPFHSLTSSSTTSSHASSPFSLNFPNLYSTVPSSPYPASHISTPTVTSISPTCISHTC